MDVLLLAAFILIGLFAFVLVFGAPYLPALTPQIETALDLLELKDGDTLLELGCGDGKVLCAAAARGYRAVGIELNPILALIAYVRTRRYKGRVRIILGNFWQTQWPDADGVYVFLLDRFMPRLDERMKTYHRPLVSVAFRIPDRKAAREKNGVYLYRYKSKS